MKFIEVSKIVSHDFALKIIHHYKYGVQLVQLKQEYCYLGPLSRIEYLNKGISLDLYYLYLD